MNEHELIIEFVPIGNSVKVSVMDPVSLMEVSIVGPRTSSQQELQRTAVQKFRYVMERKKASEGANQNTGKPGRGIIV